MKITARHSGRLKTFNDSKRARKLNEAFPYENLNIWRL